MNLKTLLAMAICLVSFQLTMTGTSQLQAQVVHSTCGCGVQTCTGCLRGKLNPVNIGSRKSNCGCAQCAQPRPNSVVSQHAVSQRHVPVRKTAAPATCDCKRCQIRRRPKVSCPSCDCDFCELKIEKTTEKKPYFKVEQKEICVPSVWLPWKKSCPPKRSKVRVINVLKKDSYECPGCKYTWSVHEPPVPKTAQQIEQEQAEAEKAEKAAAEAQAREKAATEEPPAPKVTPDAFDLDQVPRPPIEEAK